MGLSRDCTARVKDESEEIDSIETTEVGVVEIGEMERSLAVQEMICGGAMISKSKCHNRGRITSFPLQASNNHNASVTIHVTRDTLYLDIGY
jgi:hypothetical protein